MNAMSAMSATSATNDALESIDRPSAAATLANRTPRAHHADTHLWCLHAARETCYLRAATPANDRFDHIIAR
eukprot:1862284-Lingulodinium_polyedra.AAC.1